jgi:N-acetyl-gamma-glutamyl-phosphate reductase
LVRQLRPDLKIVDLGADYRLHNKDSWKKYYHGEHAGTWVYGLPELPGSRTQIADSLRVANPGCYATAVALALAPLATFKDLDLTDVVVVAASGTTGAGRSAKVNLSASEIMNSLTSYKFGGVHQHTPEIEESIALIAERNVKISFTPILAPMPRGILATITLRCELPYEVARESFVGTYANERFVSVLPDGRMPETSSLIGSNSAQIQLAVDEHTSRLIISIAIDNLGKGAAGQAIQNANLMSGFAEALGLSVMGIGQ